MAIFNSRNKNNLLQSENRQLKIEKLKKLKIGSFFLFVSIAGRYDKKKKLDFLRTFDQFSILYDFN